MSYLRTAQRIGQTIPVLIILTIVVWSYYAFVISLCNILPTHELKTVYLVVYHGAFIMFLMSYIRAVFSEPGSVPPQFYLTQAEKEALDRCSDPRNYLEEVGMRLPIHETTLTNTVRYCEVCICIKPDRAHHCSLCQRCVLKMDHHCPWINNCVGFRNYKFFATFLLYSCVYCMTIALFVAPWAVYIWNKVPELHTLEEMDKFNVMILFFIAGMFFLAVSGLWTFHIFLTGRNKSTLEMGRSPRFKDEAQAHNNPYDIGCKGNCYEVYGTGPLMLCPLYTTRGNGILYPRDRTERNDMRRLLGSTHSEEEEDVIYNSDIPLNLEPATA